MASKPQIADTCIIVCFFLSVSFLSSIISVIPDTKLNQSVSEVSICVIFSIQRSSFHDFHLFLNCAVFFKWYVNNAANCLFFKDQPNSCNDLGRQNKTMFLTRLSMRRNRKWVSFVYIMLTVAQVSFF